MRPERHIGRIFRLAALAACVTAVEMATVFAADADKASGAGAEIVTLDVKTTNPVRLTPDGKAVVYLQRNPETKTYTYRLISADGKTDRKLLDSAIQWEDLFTSAFGRGIVSPDGKHLLAATTDNGKGIREGGQPRMVIVSMASGADQSKPIELPCKRGCVASAVFTDANIVWYADMNRPRSPEFSCLIRRYDLTTGKTTDVADLGKATCIGLTLSPDGKRLGGCLAVGGRRISSLHLWVFDLTQSKWQASAAAWLNDYLYDGSPWVVWGGDGNCLYSNGKPVPSGPGNHSNIPFSIVAFVPGEGDFVNKVDKGTLAFGQQDRNMAISAAGPGGTLWASDRKTAYRVDTATDKATAEPNGLLLLDSAGRTNLYRNLKTGCLATGPAKAAATTTPTARDSN